MKYHIAVHEVHINTVEVEADSPEDAIDAVIQGNYTDPDDLAMEYSHSVDSDCWQVFDAVTGEKLYPEYY